MSKLSRRDALTTIAMAGSGLAVVASSAVSGAAQAPDKPAAAKVGPVAKFTQYTPLTFTLDGYKGLNKDLLEEHYTLYKGYVTNTNKANNELAQMLAEGKADTPEFAEVRRRLGFEYDGMRLHDYYFGGLKPDGTPVDEKLRAAVSAAWGSWDVWMQDFIRTGMMRGIGWAILYQDPMNGALQNFWVTDHELGHPVGFRPILAMDVWEHAYIKQYGATGRKAYIDAFFRNVDWATVAKRMG